MRWKGIVKDFFILLVGLMAGLCMAQYLSSVQKSECPVVNKVLRQTLTREEDTSLSSNKSLVIPTKLSPSAIPHQRVRKVKRPKYLKDELHIRHPLYIGVVTAASFLNSRATVVNNTWARNAPRVEYFAAVKEGVHPLPVVSLPGVDDTYPPQKKVYRMLRYIHDKYINDYNWFMRTDDDAYIRVPEMITFLSQLDPSEPLYMGSPGFGREGDLGRIKLLPHEHYCMGGPGVVFSRELLIRLVPHLDECLENVVVSWNEDLEVGRCISRRLGIQCTWSHEMRKLFYMDYSKGVMFKDPAVYRDKTFASLITVHPFKSSDMMYRIHQFFLEIKLVKLEKDKRKVLKELEHIRKITQRVRAFP